MKKSIIFLALVISGFCLAFSFAEDDVYLTPEDHVGFKHYVDVNCTCLVGGAIMSGTQKKCTALFGATCTDDGSCIISCQGVQKKCQDCGIEL